MQPHFAWAKREEPAWPSRVRFVLQAFALHAAELESTANDVVRSLGKGSED